MHPRMDGFTPPLQWSSQRPFASSDRQLLSTWSFEPIDRTPIDSVVPIPASMWHFVTVTSAPERTLMPYEFVTVTTLLMVTFDTITLFAPFAVTPDVVVVLNRV